MLGSELTYKLKLWTVFPPQEKNLMGMQKAL